MTTEQSPGFSESETTSDSPASETKEIEVGSEEQETSDVDSLRAQIATEKKAREKAENTLNSWKGTQRKDGDQSELLRNIMDGVGASRLEMAGLKKTNQVYMEALQSGESEGVPGRVAQIDQETAAAAAQNGFVAQHDRLWNKMAEITENGQLIDVQGDGKYAEFRNKWIAARDTQDAFTLAELLVDLGDDVKIAVQQKSEVRVNEVEKEKATVKQDTLEEHEMFDMDAGGASAPADMSDTAFWRQWGDRTLPSTEANVKRATEIARGMGITV